jgi:hypothetical protein
VIQSPPPSTSRAPQRPTINNMGLRVISARAREKWELESSRRCFRCQKKAQNFQSKVAGRRTDNMSQGERRKRGRRRRIHVGNHMPDSKGAIYVQSESPETGGGTAAGLIRRLRISGFSDAVPGDPVGTLQTCTTRPQPHAHVPMFRGRTNAHKHSHLPGGL